ncbi:MAG: hypothetical protein ACODAJ_02535 [Planctomycetota bacterium]
MRNVSPLLAKDHPDRVKKWRPCLGCGQEMFTDRGHRICRKCRRRHNASPGRRSYHVATPAHQTAGDSTPTILDF